MSPLRCLLASVRQLTEPSLEQLVRAGRFEGLNPQAVEELLGEKPKHFYDIADQPDWVKRARQWAYEEQLPEFIYPVHAWSAGYGGDIRSPLTWFACTGCGSRDLGSPYAPPKHGCWHCYRDENATWQVADAASAWRATSEACERADGTPEPGLMSRVMTAPSR